MLGVSDFITNKINTFQKYFQHTKSFFLDQARNRLDTASARQSANRGLGDTLDIISKDLVMTPFPANFAYSLGGLQRAFPLAAFLAVCFI